MWLPHIGAERNADDKGHGVLSGEKIEIGDAHHDIVLLVGLCSVLDQVEFPEILLSGL